MAKDMIFKDVEEQDFYTLENQQGSTRQVDEQTLDQYLELMFEDLDQFIILTPPCAQRGIRYLQARLDQDGQVEVELAVQVPGGIRLLYRMVSERLCRQIFFDYFRNTFDPDLAEYQPVEF